MFKRMKEDGIRPGKVFFHWEELLKSPSENKECCSSTLTI